MDADIGKLMHIVKDESGIDLSMYDERFLRQVVHKRFPHVRVSTVADYVRHVSGNPDERDALVQSLNITHTEFFRNPLTFAHIEQWILPSLSEAKAETCELRIWSAGCSTGQEAYSIAMLMENLQGRNSKQIRYRIIATDISESALIQASEGIYRESDVQRIRLHDLNEYFIRQNGTYAVNDRLKKHVWFHAYDLLDSASSYPRESIFGNFDLVVCSNLLFYYRPASQHDIMRKLINSMDAKGFLITGEAERQIVERFNELYPVASPSPIYKQRRSVQ